MHEQLFIETLEKNHLRKTAERLKVFNTLKQQDQPFAMSEIVALCRSELDRSTVYRTIDVFEKIGVTTRVYSGWKYSIELSDMFNAHHHHMTCTNCGKIIAFEESTMFNEEIRKQEKQYGFKTTSHSLELKGLCATCCL